MNTTLISIDPGSKGFICAYNPHKDTRVYLSIEDSTRAEIAHFLRDLASVSKCTAVMEAIHAIRGSSAKATFSFGEIYGFLQGLFTAYDIPYILVPPQTWQKEVWQASDKVFEDGKKINTKKTSINAATRLFPYVDFRKNDRCRTIDDNKVDATLIGEYARRKGLI